jgi:hypothetical protein
MPDCPSTLKAERLRERIAHLEEDRGGLMASIRHMRRGRLDGSTDSLRAELARALSPGVLLEDIEPRFDAAGSSWANDRSPPDDVAAVQSPLAADRPPRICR